MAARDVRLNDCAFGEMRIYCVALADDDSTVAVV